MKKWKISVLLFLAISVLTGCGPGPSLPDDPSGDTTFEEHGTEESGDFDDISNPGSSDTDIPPSEGMVRSILTNEWVSEEAASTRPIAVMTPNEVLALPHYSLSSASVIYEAKVEGSMTRMMAIYEDWQDLKKIGNVRSLRSYFAYWAFEWDSVIVHYGGPYFIYDLLQQENTESVDGMCDSSAFFRTADKDSPHNAYTSGKMIAEAMKKKDYSLQYRGLCDETHFVFADPKGGNDLSTYGSDAQNAVYIDMTESYPLTRCYFKYNEDDGLYYRSQYLSGGTDAPHIDAVTDSQLTFSNVIVQRVKQEDIGNGYLAMQCHDTTRDGWFFTKGKGIHVTWEKVSDYGATRYYDDNGYQVSLNTGKTMILIIKDTDSFTYR